MYWFVMKNEWRLLIADRTLWLVSVLFLGLIAYGLYNGLSQIEFKNQAVSGIYEQERGILQERVSQHRRIMAGEEIPDPFANPVDPASMGGAFGARHAVMPARPLAPLALGQSDMLPGYFKVTYHSKVHFIHNSDIENPWHLLSGHFDLAFVIIYLFPLLIFALSYNLLSAEREQGTLRMLLSQPLALSTLVMGKVTVRALVLLGFAVLAPICVLLAVGPDSLLAGSATPLMLWVLLVVVYGLFWFALAVAINVLGRSSSANAMILISSWVVLVLIVPVLLNLAVTHASPAPSRAELATQTRLITIDGLNRYADLLSADYRYTGKPELLLPKNGRIDVPERRRAHYLIQKDVDEQIQDVLEEFDTQLAGQQALVGRYGMISPAVVLYESMTDLAGTGSKRYAHFMDQIDDYHRRWKEFFIPRILDGAAITEADFDQMPVFSWVEEEEGAVRRHALRNLVQIVFPVLLLVGVGVWGLRRYPKI